MCPNIRCRGQAPKLAPNSQKGARVASALRILQSHEAYIFSMHFLAVSSHAPPALSQLALSVAFVTSPAKAGPVKASANAKANVETSVFMDIYSLTSVRVHGGVEATPAEC
jgi:hypothetical protein